MLANGAAFLTGQLPEHRSRASLRQSREHAFPVVAPRAPCLCGRKLGVASFGAWRSTGETAGTAHHVRGGAARKQHRVEPRTRTDPTDARRDRDMTLCTGQGLKGARPDSRPPQFSCLGAGSSLVHHGGALSACTEPLGYCFTERGGRAVLPFVRLGALTHLSLLL